MSNFEKDIKERIDAYVKGTLDEEAIAELWIEFAKNPSLLEDLELEAGVAELIKEHSKKSVTKPPKLLLPRWFWHASAAAVILFVVALQLFQVPNKSTIQEIAISEIALEHLEASNGTRSIIDGEFDVDSVLNLGFKNMVEGETSEALLLFNEVIEKSNNPDLLSKAHFNSGIIEFNAMNYDSAITGFSKTLEQIDTEERSLLLEKTYWFLANSYALSGESELARLFTYEAYLLDGIFRKEAFLLLQKLNYDLGYSEINTE